MGNAKLLAAAKSGNVDKIFKLTGFEEGHDAESDDGDEGDAGDVAIEAYRWLLIAEDFGNDVEDALDAMHIGSIFHYDSEQATEALVHFELGLAYLRGEDGLKVDPALGRDHLETARDLKVHLTTDVVKTFDGLRRKLKADAWAIFEGVFAKKAGGKKKVPAKKKAGAKKAAPAAKKKAPATKKAGAKKAAPAAKKKAPAKKKAGAKKAARKK